jgi:hypothetical protein
METKGEGGIPIADFDIRKPDFKQDQERVLSTIKVSPIESPVFDEFRGIFNENKDFYGLKIFTPDESRPNEKVYFRQSRNGVMVFQKLRGVDNEVFSSDIKIVDKESEKLFSVEPLRYVVGNVKDRTVISYKNNSLKHSGYFYDNAGGVVEWNESEFFIKMFDLRFGNGSGVFFSLLNLFHEFGHRYQFEDTPIFSEKGLKKNSFGFEKMNDVGKMDLVKRKQFVKETERNAWAFTLSLVMKLKHLGVDVTRGLTGEQVAKGIDFYLSTYDRDLKRIPGNEISNRERRKTRE